MVNVLMNINHPGTSDSGQSDAEVVVECRDVCKQTTQTFQWRLRCSLRTPCGWLSFRRVFHVINIIDKDGL